ncbi:hypothetical protein OEZ85_006777 [Tetradesmus obliquus]|uniref:FAD-binding domain-containing protein n=1 Tax=Tetradesmus obliquus TaxID=3088 RepID=A0ABY8TVP9_TETOB|nr:hypothetical protein OEZ85_006777 [Tetradesmus obliquus]
MDPVLVVGAGPVGLAAAAFLAHAGTPVRIIDANAAPTTLSKALVLWRHSLLTLAPLIPPSYWHSIASTTLDQRWLLGDFKYEVDAAINAAHKPQHKCEGSLQPGTLFMNPTDVGLMGLIPLGNRDGQLRVVWNADAHCPGEPTIEDFQQLLTAHTRQQIRLTEPVWLSEFKINERQVQSYVHHNGRVLLAGDAAHIHSPAGGLGMNTGLQDAANLAWKLSLVAAGEAAAGSKLLDTYQEERHPVGAHVIRMSGRLLRANALRSPFVRFVRKWVLRALVAVPSLAAKMVSALTGDEICYSRCTLAAAAAAAAAGGAAVRTRQPATAAERQVWGCCKPAVAGRAGVGVLVRPDGIVAAVGGPDEVNGWLKKHVVPSSDAAACS